MLRCALMTLPLVASLPLAACSSETPEATAKATAESTTSASNATTLTSRVVEASCGQCQLGLPGSGCDLAVAFDGRAYYVDGSHIDDHGDAHAPNGMCNAVLKARVSGSLVENRFQATEFVVVEDDAS